MPAHAETLPKDKRELAQPTPFAPSQPPSNPVALLSDALSVLGRSRLFAQLAVVMSLSGLVMSSLEGLLLTYLDSTLGFGTEENGNVFVVLGIGSLLVQVCPPFTTPGAQLIATKRAQCNYSVMLKVLYSSVLGIASCSSLLLDHASF